MGNQPTCPERVAHLYGIRVDRLKTSLSIRKSHLAVK